MKPKLYKNREWLRHKYKIEGLLQREIAEECSVTRRNIGYWMKKHRIKTGGKMKYGRIHVTMPHYILEDFKQDCKRRRISASGDMLSLIIRYRKPFRRSNHG